ncbi:5'-nucleotidase C-terminal domain-containing protein, partial [Parabacteroides sp. OttesenSCG-928-G06]|nr:5'-nucleotidase C-terminal domain-containing protein [Parabacteroides sp. OttesenSCG-928-G06]
AATPAWVCKSLWKGLLFKDLEETAREWMAILREKEKPDVVIGLFHSGGNARMVADRYKDDVSLEIARQVPGFDIVLMGHDHTLCNEKIVNVNGDSVLVINPGHEGAKVADVSLQIIVDEGKVIRKQVCGQLVDVDEYEPDPVFLKQFDKAQQLTSRFVSKKIGVITETMTTRPAYFGPSAFVDYLHSLQLDITGADISFASPLSFDAQITRGDISVGDMFRLYRYKNLIYTMTLTGKEVRDYLEESYAQWTNQMLSPDDHLLLFRDNYLLQGEESFTNMYYYFDSAAGIIYTVNVTKPKGEKVDILCMSDGSAFHEDRHYDVAMTSYRANGGGDLLTKGAGLSVDALDSRVKAITQKDFRYYLIQSIKIDKVIHPDVLNHWKFIPEDWVKAATEKDYLYLFGED